MKKDILYLGNLLLPDGDAASHRVLGNAKALRDLGYHVSLLGCKDKVGDNILNTKFSHKGFDIYYFKQPKSVKSWFEYLFNYRWLKPLLNTLKPGVIILYNYPAIAMKKFIRYCNRNNIKIIADSTEWFVTPGLGVGKILKRMDTSLRMKRYQLRMDGIIAISSYLCEYYSSKGIPTICVPPLIDKNDEKWVSPVPHPNDVRELIYVGNPGAGMKDKLDVVIAALESITQSDPSLRVHFTIIGITKEEYCIKISPISDRMCKIVTFKGKLPNSQSLEYIKKGDYTIFLRDRNLVTTAGFPTKFSESIACGTPVLTNDTSDIAIYLKNRKNGFLIDTSSFESICSSLYNALIVNKEEIKNMKDYCMNDTSFDYHSYIDVFQIMFPCQN